MPMPQKSTPLKYCAHCETQLERKRFNSGVLESLFAFSRRKYCDRGCMAKAFEAKPKKTSPGWMTAHYHARKICPPGPCVSCGRPDRAEVHHKDENWQNNSPENLERLCRSCHLKAHSKHPNCKICGVPQKALGYCSKHYQRWKTHGNPRAVKVNQHGPVTLSGD